MKLRTYLRFNDNKCREAMNFYKECFGGELSLQTVAESRFAKEMPPESQENIMEGRLKTAGFELYGSDMMVDKATVGDNISMNVIAASEAELKTCFDKLARGGEIFMKPEKMPWGEVHSMLTDAYGIEWMITYNREQSDQ